LLKSIPASTGMSCPQLFLHAKPNPATYQAQDHKLVLARQATKFFSMTLKVYGLEG
jgi:hypothetical protein